MEASRHLFTKFSVADKQRIEDLTGCIPLLLGPFVAHPGEPLEVLEPQIWDDAPLATVVHETMDFAQAALRSNLHNELWVVFLGACFDADSLTCSSQLQ